MYDKSGQNMLQVELDSQCLVSAYSSLSQI